MKILFLLQNTGMYERLGIMTLSSILKKHGHDVRLLLTGDLNEEKCIAQVKDFEPHILAYSIMTGEHNYHIELNQMIRSHYSCLSVFGGPHPTFKPDMIEKDHVDAVCRGEGDVYFLQLIQRMEEGEDFYNIPNFWFKKHDGYIIKNNIGLLADKMDELPFPDRALMYDADHALGEKGCKSFMSMRGCPYQCTYCFNHAYNKMVKDKGEILRYRSVDNLISEIKDVKENYFLDMVLIHDDTFLLKPKGWLEEFAQKYPKEIDIPIICNVRANLIDDGIGKLLKQLNCIFTPIGVECGNNDDANKVLARNLSNNQITEACKILHKYNIKIMTQNLIGLPVDNPLKKDLETLDFNIALKPDFALTSLLYPYPGTKIEQLAVREKMFKSDFEKIAISNKTISVMDFGDEILKRKIVNLHKLFGIIVQFPFLRPITPFLISLPLTRFYTWIYFAFYGYKILRLSSMAGMLRTIKNYIVFYLKYVSQLEKQDHDSHNAVN